MRISCDQLTAARTVLDPRVTVGSVGSVELIGVANCVHFSKQSGVASFMVRFTKLETVDRVDVIKQLEVEVSGHSL